MACRLFRIEGRVQGVWFRESTRRRAEPLDITGYAVNQPDGSVEVLACGSEEALQSLEQWLHRGPRLANVTGVTSNSSEAACPGDFRTG